MENIVHILDFINEHKVLRYVYLIIISYIWIKFKATKFYGVALIWIHREKLIKHSLFENVDLLTAQISSQITSMGKREAYSDFLRIESGLFTVFLNGFIRRITCKHEAELDDIEFFVFKYSKNLIEYFYKFDYNHYELATILLSEYDGFLREITGILENGLYHKIQIKQTDIIKYARSHLEYVPDLNESYAIREIIQRQKLRKLIMKYDNAMYDYRIQIKKNLALQITNTDLNMYELLKAILKYSFQSVYKAMEITFPKKINALNGDISQINYNGFDCI